MFKVTPPGVAWVAIVGFASSWISTYYGNWYWTPAILAVLGLVVQLIRLYGPDSSGPTSTARGMELGEPPPSKASKLWFGG